MTYEFESNVSIEGFIRVWSSVNGNGFPMSSGLTLSGWSLSSKKDDSPGASSLGIHVIHYHVLVDGCHFTRKDVHLVRPSVPTALVHRTNKNILQRMIDLD
jgi:hypothetical protein